MCCYAAVVHVPYDVSMSTFPTTESCVATDAAASPAPDCSFTPGDASSCDSSSCTYTAAKGYTADPHFDTPIEATVGDTLHIMWTDPETVPASNTADGTISMMVHDVTELTEDQFATCSFDGLTPMTSHEEPGDAACELTAGTDCSTTDARCTYTPPVDDDPGTDDIDETVAEACAPKPREYCATAHTVLVLRHLWAKCSPVMYDARRLEGCQCRVDRSRHAVLQLLRRLRTKHTIRVWNQRDLHRG